MPELDAAPEGVSARELAKRAGVRASKGLNPNELQRWLTAEGLAEVDDAGTLRPTARALSIGAAIEGRVSPE